MPLIEAEHLTRVLPATVPVTLVQDVSLTVGEQEFIAITGPSGSGKSSLLYLLGLLDRPTSGSLPIRISFRAACASAWPSPLHSCTVPT